MSGTCCGGSRKTERTKVEMATASQASQTTSDQPTENVQKNECCSDKPAKSERRGCGCDC